MVRILPIPLNLKEVNMKEYKKGDVVYVAQGGRSLYEYEIFSSFIDEDSNKYYILRANVPGINEWAYIVRDWATISETKEGPLNCHTKERLNEIRKIFKIG
jgi:hypothetical protein